MNAFSRFFNKPTYRYTQTKVNFWLSLYFATVLNYALYAKVLHLHPFTGASTDYFIFSIPVFIFCVCYLIFSVLTLPFVHKVIVPFLLIVSSAIAYNSIFFDVYFNRDMLTNVLQTTPSESRRLMTLPFIAWIIGFGIIPAILYAKIKINYRKWYQEILYRLGFFVLAVLGILAIAAAFYQDYASFGRNNLSIKHLIIPTNFIVASSSKYRHFKREQMPYQVIEPNAVLDKADNRRKVTVMIIGETARANNWGLNGYARQTTPLLAGRGNEVVNFNNVISCNTFTAGSVPCMFSHLGRGKFNADRAEKQDNLLDILQRAGVYIDWFNNNSDCKGVCKNTPYTNVTKIADPKLCTDGECLDDVLLPELDKALQKPDELNKDAFIVLHTIGSHGPTYYERYTDAYRKFTPTCDTNKINQCSNEQLVNTYDNTILYTDKFINQVIERLESHKDWKSSVIYVSDHGESLGENGIYLHSTPYDIAPKYQTHVPMIMWFNETWRNDKSLDYTCLQNNAKSQNYSHDNLYSTIYAMMDLKKQDTYQADLDILHACKKTQ
ncbi:putative cell division protein [Moraxella macacae 0408225]|uniref:Putative cell division protein n=1 Tax=Moraxella macacae 0408225 TaxID=1230338 RepID=L2F7W5_9GAMM|nr:phosphoethanolamine--lipid A transferase [Moraxella macacae]ELA09005.1 putative cell division protein [Moraxella macacae 0408225]